MDKHEQRTRLEARFQPFALVMLLHILIPGRLLADVTVFTRGPLTTIGTRVSIVESGAVGDGQTVNTAAIQRTIDGIAERGGGTVIIPPGRFLCGAIFLKPGVNLHLEKDAVLLGSTNLGDYPAMPTRIEGQTVVWRPALLTALHCDGLRISGSGTLQGGGKPFWDAFWKRLAANRKTKNLDVERPRNLFVQDSRDVRIAGISLRDSGFWNIHLYRCQDVTLEQLDIRTPPRAPSTDGIDVDSCQRVHISGCYISVDDDNIALKGTKGPFAAQDKESPPVEEIRISGCTFGLGHGVLTLGSEACQVRDVVIENCRVEGPNHCLARFKLRPDTPQRYEDIHFRNISVLNVGMLVSIAPWTTYFDLKGQPAPVQEVRNITLENITGQATRLGTISGPAKSLVSRITLKDVAVEVTDTNAVIRNVEGFKAEKVLLNGFPLIAPDGSKESPK